MSKKQYRTRIVVQGGKEYRYSPSVQKRLAEFAESPLYEKARPRTELAGLRFGRLVIQRVVAMNRHRQPIVLCHCDCGEADIKLHNDLTKGTKSCGCLRDEIHNPFAGKLRKHLNLLLDKAQAESTNDTCASPGEGK